MPKDVGDVRGVSEDQMNEYGVIHSRVIVCHPQGTECRSECW